MTRGTNIISLAASHDEETQQSKSVNDIPSEPRYLRQEMKILERFTVNALKRIRHKVGPVTGEAPTEKLAHLWQEVITNEIDTMRNMDCWYLVDQPVIEKVLHSNYVVFMERDQIDQI